MRAIGFAPGKIRHVFHGNFPIMTRWSFFSQPTLMYAPFHIQNAALASGRTSIVTFRCPFRRAILNAPSPIPSPSWTPRKTRSMRTRDKNGELVYAGIFGGYAFSRGLWKEKRGALKRTDITSFSEKWYTPSLALPSLRYPIYSRITSIRPSPRISPMTIQLHYCEQNIPQNHRE